MKIVGVGDLHICDDSRRFKLSRMFDAILAENADVTVLAGDIADPWQAPWAYIVVTETWNRLQRMVTELVNRGRLVIWIDRNHDWPACESYLYHAVICGSWRAHGTRWEFRHGWEFDTQWSGLGWVPGVSPIAFWIASRHPRWMVPIFRFLYGTGRSPGSRKRQGTFRQDWTWKIETGHARARLYAKKQEVNLSINHFHCPSPFDGLIIDTGDGVDSFSYVVVPDAHRDAAELRFVK